MTKEKNRAEIAGKLKRLRREIRKLENAIVSFSGGVDSTLILKICADELGKKKTIAVTAVSDSYPKRELAQARKIAKGIGIGHIIINTKEINDKKYSKNTPQRCYFCKMNLYGMLKRVAKKKKFKHILNGANADDALDYRPGMKAADKFNVLSPLKNAGMTKREIIAAAKKLGLPNWNKPASPCLASRIPYGIEVTPEKLSMIEKAEDALFGIGLKNFRVRFHGEIARIEVERKDFGRLLKNSEKISKAFKKLGFRYVTMDMGGFKSGNLNYGIKK
ncbi:MAG: ATP-dependent sacrificial sulfur transferase LarE [Candidatus Micrarchaeia archaeon]